MDEALGIRTPQAARAADLTFDEFFHTHRDGLFSALWVLGRDRHEAEEVAQDAFLKLWERWEQIRGLENPVGYLYRTALNLHRNRRRRAALALRRMVRAAPAPDPIAAVDARDAVIRALGALTPDSAPPSSSPTCST